MSAPSRRHQEEAYLGPPLVALVTEGLVVELPVRDMSKGHAGRGRTREAGDALVGVMVVDVRGLGAVLEAGRDGVLGNLVVGVFARHSEDGGGRVRGGRRGKWRDGEWTGERCGGGDSGRLIYVPRGGESGRVMRAIACARALPLDPHWRLQCGVPNAVRHSLPPRRQPPRPHPESHQPIPPFSPARTLPSTPTSHLSPSSTRPHRSLRAGPKRRHGVLVRSHVEFPRCSQACPHPAFLDVGT